MSGILAVDQEYMDWVSELKDRYWRSQIKAASSVNRQMLLFYWSLGRDAALLKAESRWGSSFVKTLSEDLRAAIPDAKGFSRTNLFYMIAFYKLYQTEEKVPQVDGQNTDGEKDPQLEGQNADGRKVPQVEGQNTDGKKIPQLGGQLEDLSQIADDLGVDIFAIPWGHHKLIMDKCKNNRKKALFFVKKTMENNWSRAVLLNFLGTNLYERQGKAISNFDRTLPSPQSDLAQEMTKDPYNFDFLTMTQGYYEKELKDALMDNFQRFLLELGTGFAFVGREYRLEVGNTEQFLDMLFYNITLHCYVVVEIKTRDFEPGDMGQVSTYVAAVDGILKNEGDARTIGLLICKTKDNVLAQYAANNINAPIGISEYELSELIPEDFKGTLPTIEEIEAELKDK